MLARSTHQRRLLLQARVDPEQKTSWGRTATAVAKDADVFGSHKEVMDMLRGGLKVLALREAMPLMMEHGHGLQVDPRS